MSNADTLDITVTGAKTTATIGEETFEFHGGDARSLAADLASIASDRKPSSIRVSGSPEITAQLRDAGFEVSEPETEKEAARGE